MPRVITPSMFWSRIRSAPSRQYALIASGLRRKLHMPFPPYGSVPPTACRFHSSMPRIIGASCEVPITTP